MTPVSLVKSKRDVKSACYTGTVTHVPLVTLSSIGRETVYTAGRGSDALLSYGTLLWPPYRDPPVSCVTSVSGALKFLLINGLGRLALASHLACRGVTQAENDAVRSGASAIGCGAMAPARGACCIPARVVRPPKRAAHRAMCRWPRSADAASAGMRAAIGLLTPPAGLPTNGPTNLVCAAAAR